MEEQQVKVEVDFKSIDDKIDINSYDFIYMGTSSDDDLNIAKEDFKKYYKDIKKYIDNKKFILVTGNSLNLFDNVLDFKSKLLDFRIVEEQVYKFKDIEERIIGFQNRSYVIQDVKENNLFDVLTGTGYEPNNLLEGIHKNNFYGTYLLGPLLVRNPYFLKYLVKELLSSKDIKYKEVKEDISYTAYREFIKNFVDNK